jgi:alpha-maltose-1-phosphate synthase
VDNRAITAEKISGAVQNRSASETLPRPEVMRVDTAEAAERPPFRASIAGLAGTHPLDLARQMSTRGTLAAFYTTLPSSRTPGVASGVTHRHLALLLAIHAFSRGWLPVSEQRMGRLVEHQFDRWARRRVVPTDIVHAVAGIGRRHRPAARRRFGALTVCDSGTTHARFHEALLDAEHAKWGVPPVVWDQNRLASIEAEYEESDLIVTPSRFAYQSFVARGIPESQLALIPYGVDTDVYRPVSKNDRVFRILYVGALSLRKGLPYLLEAVTGLTWGDAELALRGGDTPESPALLRGYRGSIQVTRIPPQPRERLKELYSSASVLVLPSVEDGFGLVIGQALACGIPVIATTHTGGPDIIDDGKNGLIVPAGDSRALRDALTRLRDDPTLLATMRVEARRRVELARGWGQYGDRIIEAFARALERRRKTVKAHGR